MKQIENNHGLTLIEIIVTLGILGIIITPLSAFFINSAKISKNAEDKLKATSIAQEYMESIKSQVLIEKGERREEKGNFDVIINIEEDSRYRFLNLEDDEESEENNNEDISYDFVLNIGEENNEKNNIEILDGNNNSLFNYDIQLSNLQKEDIKINIDKKQNSIVFNMFIKDKLEQSFDKEINDEKTNLNIKVYNLDFIIEAENHSNKDLEIYLSEDIDSTTVYDHKNIYGEITWHKNIYDEEVNFNHNSRLYIIEITVMKDEKILFNIKGYKVFYNSGSV